MIAWRTMLTTASAALGTLSGTALGLFLTCPAGALESRLHIVPQHFVRGQAAFILAGRKQPVAQGGA